MDTTEYASIHYQANGSAVAELQVPLSGLDADLAAFKQLLLAKAKRDTTSSSVQIDLLIKQHAQSSEEIKTSITRVLNGFDVLQKEVVNIRSEFRSALEKVRFEGHIFEEERLYLMLRAYNKTHRNKLLVLPFPQNRDGSRKFISSVIEERFPTSYAQISAMDRLTTIEWLKAYGLFFDDRDGEELLRARFAFFIGLTDFNEDYTRDILLGYVRAMSHFEK